MLAPIVKEIAPGRFGQRVNEQGTFQIAGSGHALDQFKVLA